MADDNDDIRDYIARSKLRRIRLLENQLSAIQQELEERGELHRETMKELESEVQFSERMRERYRKFGHKDETKRREGEIEEWIQSVKQERWKEQVRRWRDTQDLLREARKLKRELNELKQRMGDLEDYL